MQFFVVGVLSCVGIITLIMGKRKASPQPKPTDNSQTNDQISGLCVVINDLIAKVQGLEDKIQVTSSTSASSPPTLSPEITGAATDSVNLHDLQRLQPLNSRVDSYLASVQPADGVSTARAKNPRTSATRKIVFTILWPHQFVHRPGTFDLIFDNLTLAEFVAGTSAILLLPELPEAEKKARLEHLQFLMLLSRSFSWDSLRALYAVALEDIQCGHRKWGDSLVDLKDLMLTPMSAAKSARTPPTASTGPNPCRKFNFSECTISSCRYQHICFHCWKLGKRTEHRALEHKLLVSTPASQPSKN